MPHRCQTPTSDSGIDVLDRIAPCGAMMHICDHRHRYFYTLEGPVEPAQAQSLSQS